MKVDQIKDLIFTFSSKFPDLEMELMVKLPSGITADEVRNITTEVRKSGYFAIVVGMPMGAHLIITAPAVPA